MGQRDDAMREAQKSKNVKGVLNRVFEKIKSDNKYVPLLRNPIFCPFTKKECRPESCGYGVPEDDCCSQVAIARYLRIAGGK